MFLHFCRNQILALDSYVSKIQWQSYFYHTKITVTLQYNNRSGMTVSQEKIARHNCQRSTVSKNVFGGVNMKKPVSMYTKLYTHMIVTVLPRPQSSPKKAPLFIEESLSQGWMYIWDVTKRVSLRKG